MKLILGNHCYLQKFDITFLLYNSVIIPKSFKDECTKWQDQLRIRNTRDHFTFIGPFVKPDSIEWINTQQCVVDYEDYATAPIKTLGKQIRKLTKEARFYTDSVHAMRRELTDNLIQEHMRATKRQAKKVQQELASLEIMRDHLEQKIDFEFPEEYTPPAPHTSIRANLFKRLFGHYSIP